MKRIEHIDTAKGIGIMLIVASHVVLDTDNASEMEGTIYHYWCNFLSSFYVPVFFLLSGVFETDSVDMNNYLRRVLRCVKYVLVSLVWGILAYYVVNGDWDIRKGALTYTPIWFLIVLLYITICFGLMRLITYKWMYVVVLMGGVGYGLAYTGHSLLMLGQTCLCLPFYAVGYWGKKWFLSSTFRPKVSFACFLIWVTVTFSFNGEQNIALNLVNKDLFFFYVDALCGSVLLIELSKLIRWNLIEYMGRNSIIIMMTHMMFIYLNYNILHIHIDSFPIWLLLVLGCIILSFCFIPLLRNKYYKVI